MELGREFDQYGIVDERSKLILVEIGGRRIAYVTYKAELFLDGPRAGSGVVKRATKREAESFARLISSSTAYGRLYADLTHGFVEFYRLYILREDALKL